MRGYSWTWSRHLGISWIPLIVWMKNGSLGNLFSFPLLIAIQNFGDLQLLNFLSQVFETLPVTLVLSSHKLVSIIVASPCKASDLICHPGMRVSFHSHFSQRCISNIFVMMLHINPGKCGGKLIKHLVMVTMGEYQ